MWKHDKFDELAALEKSDKRKTGGRGGFDGRTSTRKDRGPRGQMDGRGVRGGKGRGDRSSAGQRGSESGGIDTSSGNRQVTDNQSSRSLKPQQHKALTPQPVTPLKASAPEFKPSFSVPHSPSPTAAAMLASTAASSAVLSGSSPAPSGDSVHGNSSSQSVTLVSPIPSTAQSFPSAREERDGNRTRLDRPGGIKSPDVYTGSEDVSVMNFFPNRRSYQQHTPPLPNPPIYSEFAPSFAQGQGLNQGMGINPAAGVWYPPDAVQSHSNMHGAPMYYPPDPWAGGSAGGAGIFRGGSPHHQQYPPAPPTHMMHHQYPPQYPPQTHARTQYLSQQQQQQQQQQFGHRLHKDAPEFTPYSQGTSYGQR